MAIQNLEAWALSRDRTQKRMIESVMSPEEIETWALEWYRERGRWPTRRFRVEGTRCGNSCLLTLPKAHSTRSRFGGTVKERVVVDDLKNIARAERGSDD